MTTAGPAGIGAEAEDPPRVARTMPAAAAPTAATTIRAMTLPEMAAPPAAAAPTALVWGMTASAFRVPRLAETRISFFPAILLGTMPRIAAWPLASVVTVMLWLPLAKTPLAP